MLLLRDSDVDSLITMADAIEVLEAAFVAQDSGRAANTPRQQVRFPGGGVALQLMGGAAQVGDLEPVVGFKMLAAAKQGARIVVLASAESGRALCMIAAGRLGQQRTGAASGVATKYMAASDAATVGVYGAGQQARAQLQAICAVRPVRRAIVYSPTPERREAFAKNMAEQLQIVVAPVDTPEEAAAAEILVTATTSATPVLRGAWVAPGSHVNAMGANSLLRRELDDELVARASMVVVDSREQVAGEALDLVGPLSRGLISPEQVRELREVVSGARRRPDEGITLFKSLGVGLEDVAVGALVYERALTAGRGEQLDLLD